MQAPERSIGETKAFWGDLARCEHVLHLYPEPDVLLETLEGFVIGGLRASSAILLIATPEHLAALEERLFQLDIDVNALRSSGQYVELDAEETLLQFMVDGMPDQTRFENMVEALMSHGGKGRSVHAFGEMVSILWSRGLIAATIELERMWHDLCQRRGLSLLCAYPQSHFENGAAKAFREIESNHSRTL